MGFTGPSNVSSPIWMRQRACTSHPADAGFPQSVSSFVSETGASADIGMPAHGSSDRRLSHRRAHAVGRGGATFGRSCPRADTGRRGSGRWIRGYSFETLRGRSLYRKNNLLNIINSGGLSGGSRILSQDALFTTESTGEDDEWEPFPEPEYEVNETTGEILN